MQKSGQKPGPNFFQSFWDSCWDTSFYAKAYRASWLHVSLHTFVLVVLISLAYTIATYFPLTKNLEQLFDNLPEVKIQNGRAIIDSSVELPKIRKFPNPNGNNLYYIIDSGKNRADLEDRYESYIILTKRKIILNDGRQRIESSWKKVEEDPILKNFFGDPIKITSYNMARFTASVAMFIVGCIFFAIVVITLPTFNFIAAIVATIADKWPLEFMDLAKLSFFAATPACLVQMFGCFFLGGTGLVTILIGVSWIIQIAYLITGLKQLKEG